MNTLRIDTNANLEVRQLTKTEVLAIFLRQVRNRSKEHQRAMHILAREGLAGQMIAVLRQELDSMVRVIYILAQRVERQTILVEASIQGQKWSHPNSRASVTDKEMVDLAQDLEGWTRSVYKFGCAFIHLSGLHDYNDRDPLEQLSESERDDILNHCRYYHGGPMNTHAKFSDLITYFPRVLEKIAGNLECNLAKLEKDHSHNAAEE